MLVLVLQWRHVVARFGIRKVASCFRIFCLEIEIERNVFAWRLKIFLKEAEARLSLIFLSSKRTRDAMKKHELEMLCEISLCWKGLKSDWKQSFHKDRNQIRAAGSLNDEKAIWRSKRIDSLQCQWRKINNDRGFEGTHIFSGNGGQE